ncbi:hypothetical protein BpJC7_28830 [Weizmannia acidilactici]|uniref:Uncharacterized protein n=1 Tax=Weizmannia acidilactici TaxID=2607726 RepID=A0A5J4JLS1_9BACI|nr:hypothetical protein [Weizmannia acidilactici]GER71580.1 hypothetical protein BpJC7_28830 [Weizmannia acidilactici]GER72083.1 hypothetical protein BpPP18_01500 [Weizmannia acidilactici]
MFDPTAFENMKTVFEGAAYDLDLSGEAAIIGRNDIVDLAGMSRDYRITLTLPAWREASATVRLFAPFAQLAAEILDGFSGNGAGAYAWITFSWQNTKKSDAYKSIIRSLWGGRHFEERSVYSSFSGTSEEVIIDFNRLITEDLMDDLLEMLHHAVKTLHHLKSSP